MKKSETKTLGIEKVDQNMSSHTNRSFLGAKTSN
jgi:hypothetical protein